MLAHGLKITAQHNNQVGTVMGWIRGDATKANPALLVDEQRWAVKLQGAARELKVREANLTRLLTMPEVHQ